MSDNANTNDNDNTTPREPIGTFTFYVSDRVTELAKANVRQSQLTVSHDQKVDLLEAAGLDPETVISRRAGRGLLLEVRTPKGAEVPLVMADTHAIWLTHQRDERAQKLVGFFAQKGGEADLDLLAVEGVSLTTGRSKRKLTAEAIEDCPV